MVAQRVDSCGGSVMSPIERIVHRGAVVSEGGDAALGVPADRVDDNRLYRTLDQLLPHKEKLEAHLKNRMGELFDLEYDLLMYDIKPLRCLAVTRHQNDGTHPWSGSSEVPHEGVT